MAFIFISFQSTDKVVAQTLNKYLKDRLEISSFLSCDPNDGIAVGKKWPVEVCDAMQHAEVVCIIVSPNWVMSPYCNDEYRLARYFNKHILTLALDEDESVKVFLEKEIGNENYLSSHSSVLENAFESLKCSITSLIKEIKQTPFSFYGLNPYKGLQAYDEEDAAVFFGRDVERKKIIDTILKMPQKKHKLCVLYGSSGTGKSSLLKAGVLSYLRYEHKKKWAILPTSLPSFSSFTRILSDFLQEEKEGTLTTLDKKFQNIKVTEQIITNIEKQHYNKYGVNPEYILIPIDQLEELFSNSNDREQNNTLFIDVLTLLLAQPQVYAITTLRSDFLYEFQSSTFFKSFKDQNFVKFEIVHPIATYKISEIIKAPALLPELRGKLQIDDLFVEKIKDDLKGIDDVLPLLSLLLSNLYEKYNGKLLESTYTKGALGKLIDTIAEEEISKWTNDTEIINQLKHTFIQNLVRIGDNEKIVKVKALRSTFPTIIDDLVEALIKSRLLLSFSDDLYESKVKKVEITHETLIKHWMRLSNWVDEERDFLKIKKEVEQSFLVWNKIKKDDNKEALLGGMILKRILSDEKLEKKFMETDFNEYVEHSIKHFKSLQSRRRIFLASGFLTMTALAVFGNVQFIRAKSSKEELMSEIKKTKHNIGLVFAERATYFLKQRKIARAQLYANYALRTMDLSMQGLQHKTNEMVGILRCFNYIKTAYIDNVKDMTSLKVVGTDTLETIYTTAEEGNVLVSNLKSARSNKLLSYTQKHTDRIYDIKLSKDENILYTASADRTIKRIDIERGKVMTFPKAHEGRISSIVLLEEKNKLVSASYKAEVIMWDLRTFLHTKIPCFWHSTPIRSITVSKDEQFLFTASYDKTIGVFDLNEMKFLYKLKGHQGKVNRVIAHPLDTHSIFTSSDDGTVREWYVKKDEWKNIRTFSKNRDSIYDIYVSHDALRLFATSKDKTITLWNLEKNIKEIILDEHTSYGSSIVLSSDSTTLVTTAWDETIRYWDMNYFLKTPLLEKSHHGKLTALSHNNQNYFATGGDDNTIKIWDSNKKVVLKTLYGHSAAVYDLTFYENNKKLISASNDRTIRLWDVQNNNKPSIIKKHKGRIYSLSIDKTQRYLASGSQDSFAYVYDLKENNKIVFSAKHNSDVFHVYFLNEKFLCTTSGKTIMIWNIFSNTRNPLYVLENHQAKIYDFISDSKNEYAYSCSGDGKILQWKLEIDGIHVKEPKYVKTFEGHSKEVYALVLLEDGKTLLSSSRDNTIKVWCTRTTNLLKTLTGHTNRIYHIALDKEDKNLLSISWDGSIRVWKIKGKDTQSVQVLREYLDCEIVTNNPVHIKTYDGKILDEKELETNIETLEKQFQISMKNTVEEKRKIPYMKPEWSKYHPFYS